ncbi:MAG: aspartyl/glutamyl-tRNA amidotransferase subunit C [Atopobiaceae bacterium]|nr:aspartyl/glutamyl-tRNA amidotransferase subunit C [Atopobiaceae bacterium]
MPLTRNDVAAIADYARIALDDDELTAMCDYMNEAVDLLEPILEYELGAIEPTYHPIGGLSNVMSADEVDSDVRALSLDDALKNAGAREGRNFRVPSILGDDGGDR